MPVLFLASAFFVIPFSAGVLLANQWGWTSEVIALGWGAVLVYGGGALWAALKGKM